MLLRNSITTIALATALAAVLLASASSEFSRVSSSVRSRTRFSRVALARSSASAASKEGVTSEKVMTSPAPGIRFERTSITMWRSGRRSRWGSPSAVAVAEGRRVEGAHEFQDFPERNADLDEMQRQAEDFAELPVRADQLQIRVEHGDALPHMVQRGLQYLAVEMQRGVRVVEQLEGCLGRDGALA